MTSMTDFSSGKFTPQTVTTKRRAASARHFFPEDPLTRKTEYVAARWSLIF